MASTRILQLTDLHVFQDPAARLKGIPTFELLQDVVDHIRSIGESFDYVVVTGDHTHDELTESYAVVRALLNPWIDRLFQVPGNHDDRAVLRSVFADRVSGSGNDQINFAFRAGSWLCLGLDTHVPGAVSGRIDSDQIDWARTQLASSDADGVVLFLHHPPVSVGSEWMDAIGLTGKELLQGWFAEEPRIRLVCCGHVHHEFRCVLHQTEIVTTPSTGIQFSPAGTTPTFVAAPPGYRIIELSDAEYSTRVVRLPEIRFSPDSV
jgi:Icc protein